GEISGTIGPGTYLIGSDLIVAEDNELILLPGTELRFNPHTGLEVRGRLEAIGDPADSIIFTNRVTDSLWSGIQFDSCETITRLEYCVIENASSAGETGGGVSCIGCSPEFYGSRICNNHSSGSGAGIYLYNSSPLIEACLIAGNDANSSGGGIYTLGNSSPHIIGCTISGNSASSGGGIAVGDGSWPMIEDCFVSDNSASYGGGVYLAAGTYLGEMNYCLISGNSAEYGGGFLSRTTASFSFSECTMDSNNTSCSYWAKDCAFVETNLRLKRCIIRGDILTFYGGAPHVVNCILIDEDEGDDPIVDFYHSFAVITNSIITGIDPVIHFSESPFAQVQFNLFTADRYDAFQFDNNDPIQGPTLLGTLITLNANEDSSDTYYNIFEDPLFIDAENGNYHLREGSPCIDAGDPNLPYDPDGTIADIGAFYFPQQQSVDNPRSEIPTELKLSQNYPNPFNATTEIRFSLPVSDQVKLELFNIQGSKVADLVKGLLASGEHSATFNGRELASGVYFYRLTSNNISLTKKMVLLK
ncbi:right-handed parallel beta-helix repeat-containing protein, partial [bacterium]|nr:right-handed parallel beta-helix repeat-containing protein [bacterium]